MSINVEVEGSHNVVQVAGGNIITNYLDQRAAAEDRRNLLNLLANVRRTWITDVLESSVHHAALLELQMRADPGAVVHPWGRYLVEQTGGDARPLPTDRPISGLFEEMGHMLLILGEPGSGKTTTLLTLAREWIDRAERDADAPVPVVLSLSTWGDSHGSLHEWLVSELGVRYYVGRDLAQQWLKSRRLLLFLDGLDEVGDERRAACVHALNEYAKEHGAPGMAVCCRSDEYRALPVRLVLGGAVSLLPLSGEQIDGYVQAAGPELAGFRAALEGHAELRALAESPLMLMIMTLAFRGASAQALRFDQAATREALRGEIFTRYVQRMFVLRERGNGVPRARVEGCLRWLASRMMQRNESIFAVALLQPACLTPRQLLVYTLLSRVASGIVLGAVIGGAVCLGFFSLLLLLADLETRQALTTPSAGSVARVAWCLAGAVTIGVAAGLLYAPIDYLRFRRARGAPARKWGIFLELMKFLGYVAVSVLAVAFVAAVAAAIDLSPRAPHLWAALVTVLVCIPGFPLFYWKRPGGGAADEDIRLAATLTWRWRAALELAAIGAVAGGIITPFSSLFQVNRTAAVAVGALVVLMTVSYGSWRHEVPPPDRWIDCTGTSALRKSARFFAYGGLVWTLVLFPVFWVAMAPWTSPAVPLFAAAVTGVVLAVPGLVWFGGLDMVLHGSLRLVLSLAGAMPLRLRGFLDYSVHLGFLQRAGSGYIFIHRLLLEHFAARRS